MPEKVFSVLPFFRSYILPPSRSMQATSPGEDSHLRILYVYMEWTEVTGAPQIKPILLFLGKL